MNERDPGTVARTAMELALRDDTMGQRHESEDTRLLRASEFSPWWPSSISAVDGLTGGGFYGLSVIAAPPKIGKSTLALASALEAAATLRWQVWYFNVELDAEETEERLRTYLAANPAAEDGLGLFRIHHVGRGVSPQKLTVISSEEPGEEPVLIVLDSVNSIANVAGGDYFRSLHSFGLWAMLARRYSCGACSFLIVSETNTRGGVKGEQITYWADMVLRMQGKPQEDVVEVDVTHSRRTRAGGIGRFLRHRPTGRFLREHEIPRPRLVEGGIDW